jgi:hypothetical protein
MKKILSLSILSIFTVVFMVSCLKDKGFDNYEYGINLNKNPKGAVSFPLAVNDVNAYGLEVTGTPQLIQDVLFVAFEAPNPAPEDVTVTLAFNPTLVTDYNTASGENLEVMPAGLYSISSTNIVIPKGSKNAVIPLSINSTLTLNALKSYGIGVSIASVSGGYTIAQNMRNMVIKIIIKNKYDGKYTMKGQFYHPSLQPDFAPHTLNVELHTTGPNSVKLYWPLVGGYNTPITSGGAPACCFASQELTINVDPATNAATAVNTAAGASVIYQQVTGYLSNTYNNRWDDATKKFYIAFGYNLPGNGVIPNPPGTARAWIDTLTRTGPR